MADDSIDPHSPSALTHNTWPGGPSQTGTTWVTGGPSHTGDSAFDTVWGPGGSQRNASMTRWMGWRLRALVLCALLACLGIAALIRTLALEPHLKASWRADARGRIELVASDEPALQGHVGGVLIGVTGADGVTAMPDALALQRSPRWVIGDEDRARQRVMRDALTTIQRSAEVALLFDDGTGRAVEVATAPRGVAGLPLIFWLFTAFGMTMYLRAVTVVLAAPSARNLVYAAMALCQTANLLLIGVEAAYVFGLPAPLERLSMPAHMSFDLLTVAAIINAGCLHPRRLPGGRWIAIAGWLTAIGLVVASSAGWLSQIWWWAQGGMFAFGLVNIGLLTWSYQLNKHPFAIVLRRFGIVLASTWALLTVALVAADKLPGLPHNIGDVGSMIWYVFLGSMLLLVPFLARSQNFTREFSLLAAISTIATSLDLLFVAVFSLGQFASLTLSLFLSLAVYSGVRQWILSQLLGSSMLTTERMFEQLYRIAREVEAHPERTPTLLSHLLGDLFEPLDISIVEAMSSRSRLAGDGSGLLVPIPSLDGEAASNGAVVLRFARRGRRLFTLEDARLTDRIVEQLRRTVRFDKAVEHGRKEERLRLAQDLHDDIGARLLTLMYKAQSAEMEDYVRHTLQDLKTLTRGLAASNHRLSHAAAEWKSDLTHRLSAAHIELQWKFEFDNDLMLTVVHWSALTRILRELVSNAIAHAQTARLEIDFRLEGERIELLINDDGTGRNPRAWSHGLGLGGVRKRVKQLGGEVEWRENVPKGISCRVVIKDLSARG